MASPYLRQTPPTKKDIFRYEKKIVKDFLRKHPEERDKIIKDFLRKHPEKTNNIIIELRKEKIKNVLRSTR